MSYRAVLAVITEHTGSTVAAHYAIALAAAGESRLVLYSAHDDSDDETVIRRTEQHAEHLFSEALSRDIRVTRITESGPIARLLQHRIAAEGIDLTFYPLAPGECYGTTLQRQTAHLLLQRIDSDLALMRIMHMGRPHPRHILVPVARTISDRAQRGRFVAALARGFHSQITLFHRLDPGKRGVPDEVSTLGRELRLHHLPVLERSGSGGIARAIAVEAVSHHHDLIVIGASERGALRRIFFGNPAGDVLHHPPCNAILFRPAPCRP